MRKKLDHLLEKTKTKWFRLDQVIEKYQNFVLIYEWRITILAFPVITIIFAVMLNPFE